MRQILFTTVRDIDNVFIFLCSFVFSLCLVVCLLVWVFVIVHVDVGPNAFLICGADTQVTSYNCCHDDHEYGDTDQNTNLFLFLDANQFIFIDEVTLCINVYIKKKEKWKFDYSI